MDHETFEHRVRRIMSGEARGAGATSARAALRAAEPLYGAIARARNRLFDRGTLRGHRLPRPVISVGNLTTGGTGKTPVVQWLVRRLVAAGVRPAVLTRGYQRESAEAASDEELLLRESLDGVPVIADPDRVAAGASAVGADATIDCFVLDDGFQHRRLHRDVDVVLIDATNPFGYGHVLPRGMLREPLSGLARAQLAILTRCGGVDAPALAAIERTVRGQNATVPIARCDHKLGDAVDVAGDARPLPGRRVFAFSGIGNPTSFEAGLLRAGATLAGVRRFADHHRYVAADLTGLRVSALEADAEAMVTTEKDWVKVRTLDPAGPGVPVWRAGVTIAFVDAEHEARAWREIGARSKVPMRRGLPPRATDSLWTE